jgi:hypothetical protein
MKRIMAINRLIPAGSRLAVFVVLGLASPMAFAQANPANVAGVNPLLEKVLIAIVSATLSLITGYILLQLKERREPRKRLSYDVEIRPGLVSVEESVAHNVSLTYKGRSAEKLAYVKYDIKNTGNSIVKGEYLRFEFAEGCEVLDSYTEPRPPKEYGVVEIYDRDLLSNERRYLIAHLEKQQQVGFRFILTKAVDPEPRVIPFNEEGDVDFSATSISRASDDRRLVEQFIRLFLLSIIVPPIFRFLPAPLDDVALGFVYMILGFALIPLVTPFSRTIARVISAIGSPSQSGISIANLNQEQGACMSISGQGDAIARVDADKSQDA